MQARNIEAIIQCSEACVFGATGTCRDYLEPRDLRHRRHTTMSSTPPTCPLKAVLGGGIHIVMWRGLSRLTDIELGAHVGAKIVGN
jgi:hypothetical protein